MNMTICLFLLATAMESGHFEGVSFKTRDGGLVYANLYGQPSDHGVVLAHGGIFNKESWDEQARILEEKGLWVLAIDFRGYGQSAGPEKSRKNRFEDVLAAVRYLREKGAERVSVVGGSMGGGASAEAAVAAEQDEIHHLILLAAVPIEQPQAMKAKKRFFIVSEGDRFASSTKDQYEKASDPKHLEVLKGNAHAQHIFKTDQGTKLNELLVDFILE